MRNYFKTFGILFFLLLFVFLFVGCVEKNMDLDPQNNQLIDELKDTKEEAPEEDPKEQSSDEQDPVDSDEKDPEDNQVITKLVEDGAVDYTLGKFYHPLQSNPQVFNPLFISIETYDEYLQFYPNLDIYNEEYFLTHSLIVYAAHETYFGIYHKIISLVLENDILTFTVERRSSEVLLQVVTSVYFGYILEYEKIDGLKQVELNFSNKKIIDYYDMKKENDLHALQSRLLDGDYLTATIRIVFNYQAWKDNGQNLFIEAKIDEYNLSELLGTINYSYYTIDINYEKLDFTQLELIMDILNDETICMIEVCLENYIFENYR